LKRGSRGVSLLAALGVLGTILLVLYPFRIVPRLLIFVANQFVTEVSPSDAIHHVGEFGRVCGRVASAHNVSHAEGAPTFLHLERPFSNQVFVAIIWSDVRLFPAPPETFEGAELCVLGTVTTYQGIAQVVVRDPLQISLGETPALHGATPIEGSARVEPPAPVEEGSIIIDGKTYRIFSDGRRKLAP
jgi:hypothetical protein